MKRAIQNQRISLHLILLFILGVFMLAGCSSSSDSSSPNTNDSGTDMRMRFASEPFVYYSGGQGQDLEVYIGKIAIRVADEAKDRLTQWLQTDALIEQPPAIEELGRKNLVLVKLIEDTTEEQIIALIERLNASGLVNYATPMFIAPSTRAVLTDEFVVRFKDSYSTEAIEDFINRENARIIKKDFLWPKCYILGFISAGGTNTLDVSREFFESDMAEYAHPNFLELMEPPSSGVTVDAEGGDKMLLSQENRLIFYPKLFLEFENMTSVLSVSSSGWDTIVYENFEGDMPLAGWVNADLQPFGGRYYWGSVSDAEYQSLMGDNYEPDGSKGWVARYHSDGVSDRWPDMVDFPEGYAPNMDTWLIYGPFDLSDAFWARLWFEGIMWAPGTETFGWLASIDGENWYGYEEAGAADDGNVYYWAPRNSWDPPNKRMLMDLTRVPVLGNLTGHDQVYVAFRFQSDATVTPRFEYKDYDYFFSYYGIFLDEILIEMCQGNGAPQITTDPLSRRQWGLNNVGQAGGGSGYDINVVEAWDLLAGAGIFPDDENEGVVVAVLDEGVDLAHEDLNLVEGYDATYDSDDPEAVDSHGGSNTWDAHGTACSGIIGAKANDLGVVGVAPGVRIMPVRIAYSPGEGSHWVTTKTQQADGILWAVRHGARVLSNSWGGGWSSDIVKDAIDSAREMGAIVLFASGNGNSDVGISYPASLEATIAVGAMSPCGERKNPDSCDGEWWWGSSHGNEDSSQVDVMAPGVLIPTTDITGDGGYIVANDTTGNSGNYTVSFNGTSSATPHAAGVVGLMLAANPDLTPDQVEEILHNTATDLGEEGWDYQTGYGLVKAYAAVKEARRYSLDLSVSQCLVPSPAVVGQTIQATCRVENSDFLPAGPLAVRVYLSVDSLIDGQDVAVNEITTTIEPGGSGLVLNIAIPAETASGVYSLIVSVDDDDAMPEANDANNTFVSTLQVIETACLVIKPSSVNFGTVQIGSGGQVNVQIKNEGEEIIDTLVITGISFSGDGVFNNTELNMIPQTPVSLDVNESTWLWLYFMPETVGTYSGTITITSNDPNAPVTQIPLSGVAVEAVAHTITATAGSGGSILPQGDVVVIQGSNRTFTITPDTCRYVSDVLVDGVSVGARTSYTFENVTTDHTISASFGLLYYGITASAGTGGSISPSGLVSVACGGGRTFTITPNEHYHIVNVRVDGASVGTPASYTFTSVDTVHTIQATFAIDTHSLTIIPNGTGTGTTTPSAGPHVYDYGSVVNLGESPTANSTFDGWSGNLDTPGGTVVTMNGDKTVTATFTLKTFTITASAGENGGIDPGGSTTVDYGSNQVFTFTPADGYEVDTVTVDGQATTVTGDTYTFMNIADNHTINVTFKVLVEETAWSKTYGHADWYTEYHTYGLDVTDDGGYVFAAEGSYNSAGGYDFWVVRLDANGGVVWEKGFGGTSGDYPKVVRHTSDSGVIVAGGSYSFHTGSSYCDMWVIKLTHSGTVEWQQTYGGTSADVAYDLKETFDEQGGTTGFLVSGYTHSFGTGGRDVWVVHIDTTGTVVNEVALGGSGDEYGRIASPTPDGGYILVADTQSFGAGGRDIWVAKLDSVWDVEWEKTFGGSGDEFPCAVVCADDGGYVVGAYTKSFGAGENDYWALKLDTGGNLVWQYTYGGMKTDTAQDLAKTDDGGYIMTGWTLSFGVDSFDSWVVKLSDAGLIQWQKSYNVTYDDGSDTWSGNEWAYGVEQAADGGYVVAGESDAMDERNGDVWIFKLDTDGALGCNMETDTGATANGTAVVTVTDTSGSSFMVNTDAVIGTTECSAYTTTPDVFTQCETQ